MSNATTDLTALADRIRTARINYHHARYAVQQYQFDTRHDASVAFHTCERAREEFETATELLSDMTTNARQAFTEALAGENADVAIQSWIALDACLCATFKACHRVVASDAVQAERVVQRDRVAEHFKSVCKLQSATK